MIRPLNTYLLVIVLTGLSWSSWAAAEPAAAAPPPAPGELLDLDFPGGTLGDYVEALRQVAVDVNVVLATPEVRDLPVPPIRLNSVAVGAAVRVVEGEIHLDGRSGLVIVANEIQVTGPNQKPVFRISTHRRGRPSSAEVHVWSVAALLSQDVKAEAILTAVETSLELMGGEHAQSQVRFHQDTGVLIAYGERQHLSAIDHVVDGMHEAAAERKAADRMAAESQRQSQQLHDLKKKCVSLEKARTALEQEREALLGQLRQYELKIVQLEGQRDKAGQK